MRPAEFPEIKALDRFIEKHDVKFGKNDLDASQFSLISGNLEISGTSYPVFIDDEYHDLEKTNKRIGIILALREFEIIEESTDYLHWCTMLGIPANSEVLRMYYQQSVNRIVELKKVFKSGELTSFISDLDFQLDAGAMQWLRSNNH